MKTNKKADKPPVSLPTVNPAISVVIPMYNAEKYIEECLESLSIQTFQDFEVIIVDDCSTDNSIKIVEEYASKFNGRLRLEKTEKNSGGGGYVPRNIGLSLASGEYVYFLDADDFILGSALEILYTSAKEYDADVVYTGSHYELKSPIDFFLHRDGEGKRRLREGLEDKIELIVDDSNKILSQLLLEEREGNFRTTWTKFIRRDFLNNNGITFPNLSNAGDFIWVINVYCHVKRFLRISSPLYFYRRYNMASVTQKRRKPAEQVSNWISAFVDFVKVLSNLENETKVLSENPTYCLAAFKSHFNWCLTCTNYARDKLSDKDIYDALHQKFIQDSPGSAVPFLFSFLDNERKINNDSLKIIKKLEKEVTQFKNSSSCPAVSVIIPIYNAEKYIGECLDSLLAQTFRNFEVIVVDDCSIDSSVEIVKSYAQRFGERLRLTKTEKNSGGGGVPRNKGLLLSRSEYIFFLDADDMLTKTALEEMYTLAKDYDVDIVNCEKFYELNSNEENINIKTYQKDDLVKKPTLETENLKERVLGIINERYLTVPWNKLIKRNLIIDNEIFFPDVKPSEDNIWNQYLLFCAKKILRVPNIVYIYRLTNDSIMRAERTPQQIITFWLNPILHGLKALDKMIGKHAFFKENPSCRYALLKKFVNTRFTWSLNSALNLTEEDIYTAIKNEFGENLGEYDVLISTLCTALYDEKIARALNDTETLREFVDYLTSDMASQPSTSRLDIKLTSNGKGDLRIISVSDNKAEITKPLWFQKNGTGYVIQSRAGKLEFIIKATSEGLLSFNLKGISVFNSNDNTNRIPHWVGYTMFALNGNVIFDKLTPAWHDKPYKYKLDVKANEEIKIQIEWLQGKSNTIEQKIMTPPNEETISKPAITPREEIIPKLGTPTHKDNIPESKIVKPLSKPNTARIDVKFVSKVADDGEFQILSVSDEKAKVLKPGWFQRSGIGYIIQSLNGDLIFRAKATADGRIELNLRGLEVRDPEDWAKGIAKRIPYWIDYTSLIINEMNIFNTVTPAWCDEPYVYNLKVKANEEVTIKVEWQPHRSNT